ncbi:TraR/DksA C4-type zinc finger protein [Acerihabitans arboris]|uniref:RNA polymerase-binding protein DksA n=1 Tax=Acerihabitans arboris TaxID=2691583 RepID=A0A845SGL6_9GAMM|nr:TraR/DksA C4-type zinc finger protein [Acerihabitans arboris]NDL61771.1 RNA polymerase-binding protein DksA [Acerihabitans arboris]
MNNSDTVILDETTLLAMPEDDYMNAPQRDFFRRRLVAERRRVLAHINDLKLLIAQSDGGGDEIDKAMHEEDLRMQLRQIDRESRLLPKIEAALMRIERGTYGYCIETGDPIGIRRLLLRPTAERSIDAKMVQEQREPLYKKGGHADHAEEAV